MEEIEEILLTTFLSDDARCQQFHNSDLQFVSSLQQYLRDPTKESLLFLGDRILQYTITADHANHQSTHTVHLHIRQHDLNSNTKLHHFTWDLLSVSGFDIQFRAFAKDIVLIQLTTEPNKGVSRMSTLLLHLSDDDMPKVETVQDIPKIANAYGSPGGDQIFLTDKLRPSLIHVLDTKTCQHKVIEISSTKEWPSKATVKPSKRSCDQLACILSSNRDVMTPIPTGRLVIYDVENESIVKEESSHCFSSEILKYSADGRIIMASSKLPCSLHFLDSTSLQCLQVFNFGDFVPFLGLPFLFPEKIHCLQDVEVLDMIPVSKVVSNSRGLNGLKLKVNEMYFLYPIVALDGKSMAVVLLNAGDIDTRSQVHLKSCV